ncbi:MAG TPA: CBS domain-containing protein [Mariprofundaceae bacterium]|nr:CBS domain-containing protein [Mariprofundaceae bacterium]
MLVRDVMTSSPVTAGKTDKVRSVVVKMITRHCGAIPVVEDGDKLVGVVSLRDVMLPLYPNYGDYLHDSVHGRDFVQMQDGYSRVMEMAVEEVMTPSPMVVSPDDPVLKAASYMGLKNLRRIPVAEGGRLVGIVSIGDINRGLFFNNQ